MSMCVQVHQSIRPCMRTIHPHHAAQALWHAHCHRVKEQPQSAGEAACIGNAASALAPVLVLVEEVWER